MTPWSGISLVAAREIRQRLRGRSFAVSTVGMVLLVLAAGVIAQVAGGDDGPEEASVAVVGTTPEGFAPALDVAGERLEIEIETSEVPDLDAARRDLEEGDVDAVLDAEGGRVLHEDAEDATVNLALGQAWETASIREHLAGIGLSGEQVAAALTPEPLEAESVADEDETEEALAVLVGMFAGIALFGALQMYGSFILMGVVEEKSSAVVEVLLARMRASRLLAGKVLGIGTVAVLQFTILLIAGAVALMIAGVEVPGEIWAALPWTAVWFVGGFVMYAFLYAIAGSLVSRQEDAQSAATPVSVLLIGGYILMFVFIGVPETTAARVLSLLPPFAPLFMPMRIAAGEAAVIDTVVALVLLGGTIVGLARLSGAIYKRLVLRRGGRVGWMEALRPVD